MDDRMDRTWKATITPLRWNWYWLTFQCGPGMLEGGYHVLGRKRAERKAGRKLARLNAEEERNARHWIVSPDA